MDTWTAWINQKRQGGPSEDAPPEDATWDLYQLHFGTDKDPYKYFVRQGINGIEISKRYEEPGGCAILCLSPLRSSCTCH